MSLIASKKKNGDMSTPSLFTDLFDNDRLFNWGFPALNAQLPAVNIRETNNEFVIDLAAPGLNKNDFKINVENHTLSISAEKEVSSTKEDEQYTRKEYSYNSFSRAFQLPEYVKSDEIKAQYKDGVLQVTLPKKEDAKKRLTQEIKVS